MTKRERMIDMLLPLFNRVRVSRIDLNHRNAEGRIARDDAVYEAYLYACVLQALFKMGAKPTAEPPVNKFRFLRAPGNIYGGANASYTRFDNKGFTFELHNDIVVKTRSKDAVLELDLLVLPKSHADRCRKLKTDPSYRKIKLLAEAKLHRDGIGTVIAKSYLGICCSVRIKKCLDCLVSSGGISTNARLLLEGHRPPLKHFSDITPLKRHAANVTAFVNAVLTELPKVL